MNCPFNESKIKMNDDEFMIKLNSERTPSSISDFNTENFIPSEYGKKSCPCSVNNNSVNIMSENMVKRLKNKTVEIIENFMNNFKRIAGEKDIYRAISVYEFYITIIFLIIILSTQNTFIAILLLGLYSRQIPEIMIKTFLSSTKDNELIKWSKRPEGAQDCNMFNSGGDYSNESGLLSSHTFLISTLIFYFIYKFTNNFKNGMNYKQYILVGLLIIWSVIVGICRVRIGCHKQHQIIIGFILGIIWGYMIYIIIEIIKTKIPRVAEDQEKVLRIFEVDN